MTLTRAFLMDPKLRSLYRVFHGGSATGGGDKSKFTSPAWFFGPPLIYALKEPILLDPPTLEVGPIDSQPFVHPLVRSFRVFLGNRS